MCGSGDEERKGLLLEVARLDSSVICCCPEMLSLFATSIMFSCMRRPGQLIEELLLRFSFVQQHQVRTCVACIATPLVHLFSISLGLYGHTILVVI